MPGSMGTPCLQTLPLNDNTRVCSEHFENSVNRRLRADEYPTLKLPRLPTGVTVVPKRRSPRQRGRGTGYLLGLEEITRHCDFAPSPNCVDVSCTTEITGDDMQHLEFEISRLRHVVSGLQNQVLSLKFSINNIAGSDQKVAFYTGFPTFVSLEAFYKFLGPAVDELIYWNSQQKSFKGKGRTRTLLPMEEFFLVLVRLRLGLFEQDIADRFGLSCSTVSRIFATWINFLFFKLREIPLWPPRDIIRNNMPKSFLELYPTTRVVLDATEIYVEKPSLPDVQQMTFSNYKNSNTFKALIGISPSGAIIFVSQLFSGSISDKQLTRQSGVLDLLESGDSVMADRGFDIQDDLTPLGVKLNIPPFLKGKSQLDEKEMVETRRIASVRIHVERAMERIKNYHIFDRVIPSSLTDLTDQIFFVCAVLCNFWPPLCN